MFDSIINTGEFLSDHWLAEAFPAKLSALTKRWSEAEAQGGVSIPKQLASTSLDYNRLRLDTPRETDPAYTPAISALHQLLLAAAGFDPQPQTMHTFQGDTPVTVPLLVRAQVSGGEMLHVLQAKPVASDDALLAGDAELLEPILRDPDREKPDAVTVVSDAISLLFLLEDSPRYIMVTATNWLLLTDAERWAEGRYLAFDIEIALARRDTKATGELAWHAGLWSASVLLPQADGAPAAISEFSDDSIKHAVGVSEDLREGLRRSVELIANEVLAQRRARGLPVEGIDELPGDITTQTLRFLYRILFLLFAEARPELGILPVGAPEYGAGYGIDRLRELVQVPLTPQGKQGHHLHDSLEVLFRLVNNGHGHDVEYTDGLVFEPLQADLFSPERVPLIDSIRLSNGVLQEVLELLLLSKQSSRKGKQRGYVSYAQLGINQLGAVYEGLMAYTGFIADQDLLELAKDGDPRKGTWMVPLEKAGEYDDKHVVKREDASGARLRVVHPNGTFVYRLAGRDRQRSASYYTPEILTRTVVKHALAELLTDETAAADILEFRVCEPALGSGAFANEAINQLAAEYLHRRQKEVDQTIDPGEYQQELQKVKAFLALHRVYGVDLNATAVELAEVSMWLNVMHPGLQAPWFGLHLRRGNSLIGGRRATYDLAKTSLRKTWHSTPPLDRPLAGDPLGANEVHHFLLPSAGWGAAGNAKEAKELAPARAEALRTWARGTRSAFSADEVKRLTRLARRVERLWALARRRLEISEYEIARPIDAWQRSIAHESGVVARAEVESALSNPDSPYQRLRLAMDAWCALYSWPVTDDAPPPPKREAWLSTLEALLGFEGKQAPAGHVGFHELPSQFHELGELDDQEAAWYGMRSTFELIAATPWLATAREIAEREGYFHWELDFAQVFAAGGFNLQVGNPPWVRLDWMEDVALGEFDPTFMLTDKIPTRTYSQSRATVLERPTDRNRYLSEASSHAGLTASLSSPTEHSLLVGLRTNLYMSFMERTWRNAGEEKGVTALVHPESHFSDPKAGKLRAATYSRLRRHWQFNNEGKLFEDVDHHTIFGIHVYGSVRNPEFRQIANVLYPDTVNASLTHDGRGDPPGVKLPNGDWDTRPHSSRVVTVNSSVLEEWASMFDEPGTPILEARLLRPIVMEHLDAIAAISKYPVRMASLGYHWTSGWNEKTSKDDGTIRWDTSTPDSWDEVVLQGPHFFVATPFAKQPNQPCTSNLDYTAWDLESLPERVIPRTNYRRQCDRSTYDRGIPAWNRNRATDGYRIFYRRMTQPSSQRSVICAIFPPGPMHVHTVHSLGVENPRLLVDIAALWSSIPIDFLFKVAGKSDLQDEQVKMYPVPSGDELRGRARIRGLRLNCLTEDFADLWTSAWDDQYLTDRWTAAFAHLPSLAAVSSSWTTSTPLRTDEERRAALVEIDALAALMLGLTADQLVSMYTGQMAVLRKYEYEMYFDANHRVLAKDNAAKGVRQQPDDYKNLQAHLNGEPCGDLLDRYKPPFRKPDREAEMRAAYAEFKERLGL